MLTKSAINTVARGCSGNNVSRRMLEFTVPLCHQMAHFGVLSGHQVTSNHNGRVQFSPDCSRLLTAGGQRQLGGQRSVEVWRTSPDLFETILVISRWLFGAALLLLVVVLPIARSLRSIRNRGARKAEGKRDINSGVDGLDGCCGEFHAPKSTAR